MIHRVFPAAGIEGVAVRQKRLAAQFLDHVHHGPDVIGPQVCEVAQLAEVHFNGHEFAVKINVADTGFFNEPLELCALAHP